jgi:hypothetical protein
MEFAFDPLPHRVGRIGFSMRDERSARRLLEASSCITSARIGTSSP